MAITKERISVSESLSFFGDDDNDPEALERAQKELEKTTESARRYLHEVYDIYPSTAPELKELQNIISFGKTGDGLEFRGQYKPVAYYLCLSDEPFVYALGDEVYISTNLINSCQDVDSLASYPAHEIEHVAGRHLLKTRALKKEVESIKGFLATASLGRIHEYEADSTAPFRLDQAGYDPSAYQNALRVFLPKKGERRRKSDVDHGSLYDRLSIQHWILKAEDFTNTAVARTEKPADLINLPENPNRFVKISQAIEANKRSVAESLCDEMSFEGLLRFVALAEDKIEFPPKKDDYDYEDRRHVTIKDSKQNLKFFHFLLERVQERISNFIPTATDTQKEWLMYALLVHSAGIGFNTWKYLESRLQKHKLDAWTTKLSYASRLLESLSTVPAIYYFADFIAQASQASGLIENGETLNRAVWGQFVSSIMDRSDLLDDVLENLGENNPLYQNQEWDLTSFAAFFAELRSKISNSNNNFSSIESTLQDLRERANGKATHQFVEKLKEKFGDRYEDETVAVLEENEQGILPQEIDRFILCEELCEQYNADTWGRGFNSYIGRNLQKITGIVHRYYSFADDDFTEEKVAFYAMRYLEKLKPDEFELVTGIQNNHYKEAITQYLQQHSVSDMAAIFLFCPFILKREGVGVYIYQEVREYITNNIESIYQNHEHDIKMIVLESDDLVRKSLNLNLMNQSDEGFDVLINYSNGKKYGFSWSEIEFMTQLNALRKCSDGLGFEQAKIYFEELLKSINMPELSATGQVFILGSLLDAFKKLKRYSSRANIDVGGDEENNPWSIYFSHPKIIALRNKYIELFNEANASLPEKFKVAQKLANTVSDIREQEKLLGKNQPEAKFMANVVSALMLEAGNLEILADSIEDLKLVYDLADYFDDQRMSAIVKRALELQMVKLMDFNEAIEFINELFEDRVVNPEVFDYIQEHLLKTKDHLVYFEQTWKTMKESLSKRGSESVALAAFFDAGFERFIEKHAIEVFEAAINTHEDDTNLRSLLAEMWFDTYCHPSPFHMDRLGGALERPYKVKLVKDKSGSSFKLEGHSFQNFVPFNTFIEQIYTLLTQNEIDIVLRKLLYSSDGLLITQEGRQKLYGLFVNKVVDDSSDLDLVRLVKDLTKVILSVDKEDGDPMTVQEIHLGEPIASLLRKRLFVAPLQPGSNKEGAEKIAAGFKGSILGYGSFARAGFTPGARSRAEKKLVDSVRNAANEAAGLPEMTPEEVEQLLNFDPFQSSSFDTSTADELRLVAEQTAQAKEHLFSQIELESRTMTAEKLSAIRVLSEIAKSRGTLGERFRQLIGYYVKLPDEYKAENDKSYDSVRGQLKYTAYRTLKREAEKASATQALKDFWADLIELRTTGKGGSLTTVYQGLMRDGSLKAVKIMVPNALMFIRETKQEALDIIAELKKLPGYKKNVDIKLAEVLVAEVANWAEQDIAAVEYELQEEAFRQAHDGTYSSDGLIEIKVPVMTETGTMFIKIEDWVDGTSLVSSQSRFDEDVLAVINQAVVENYEQQLSVPVMGESYLIHSNVHGGQLQITGTQEGGVQIYILDRGFWLEFSATEKPFFDFVIGQEVTADLAIKFVKYLYELPENQHLSTATKMKISTNLALTVGGALIKGTTALEAATALLIDLRKENVYVPVKWTLLQANDTYLSSLRA